MRCDRPACKRVHGDGVWLTCERCVPLPVLLSHWFPHTCTNAIAFIDARSDILYVRIIDEKKPGENLKQVTAGSLKETFSTV